MSLSRFSAGILIGVSAFFYSCDRLIPLPKPSSEIPALAPSSDELYVFQYGRLSMSGYERLRSYFPELSATDVARLAMAAQWLTSKTVPGKNVSLRETAQCVRAIFQPTPPPLILATAKTLLLEKFGIQSLALLSQNYSDASRQWVVEWNPNLLSEYRISTPRGP